MKQVTEYVRDNWKWWSIVIPVIALTVCLLSMGGCSTVSGFAQDLGTMSDYTARAMGEIEQGK
jgi:uncharacterized protein YceK